jgi:protein phosphatase
VSGTADRVAVISDIHGNMPALQAVLADIRSRGIELIYCLGDMIGKGPDGAAAIDLCRQVCVATVQGNWDANVAGTDDHPLNAWARAQLGPERLGWLRTLPPVAEFHLSGRAVRLFHASEKSVFHRVRQYDTQENHLAMFDSTEFTGDGPAPDIVGYGDIHVGYIKSFGQKCLFNAGSVGNPLDVSQACYAILEGTYQGTAPAPWSVGVVRVPYDIEEAIRQAKVSGMPGLDYYANELRTARYRGLTPRE